MIALQPSWAWTPEGVVSDPIVTIDDGIILRCSTAERHLGVPVERLPGRLLVPGLVDAHSHAFQRAFRGHVQWRSGDHDDFWSWRRAMYKVASSLPPEGVQAVSELAFLELLEGGVTRVGEFHYLHHQPDGQPYADPDELARRVLAAARSVGVQITLLWVVYGRGGPGSEVVPEQRRFLSKTPDCAARAVQRLRPSLRLGESIGLAPHSVRAVPPGWWPELASFPGVVHAHVSEQPREVEQCRAETGLTPLELLAEHGVVGPRFTGVHLTHPQGSDLEIMRRSGASLAVCPSTELDLADGFLPLAAREGIALCVGSDSHASADLWSEARALELHARALSGRRCVMAPPSQRRDALAERLLTIASRGGARALGAVEPVIAEGQQADLVALDLRRPAAAGVPPLVAAAFLATPDWVERVWVRGVPRVIEGQHPSRAEIVARATPWLTA